MKRFGQKVRDIVDVRTFAALHDYAASPGSTVESYYFTDTTADLMAGWLDSVAEIKGTGAALAMAGFRGVGKSHFLAAFGALLSKPELRSRISDPHVATCAERLSRRQYTVIEVRRGSGKSLLEELKDAVAVVSGVDAKDLSNSLNDLLLKASEKRRELPLAILIDTAVGRETRVARDDGVLLGEIADTAKNLGFFVGLALDDDIAGADGVNASIVRTFAIHYLEQDHLYKIVEAGIFPKHEEMRPVLHDVYGFYRETLLGFRWSEPRFSSLYPLHPAIMEIAPFIRLYLQEFALLGFAAEAGVKIMGRPADSLIALDEVFDTVESDLRKVGDLSDLFTVYDEIDRDVIAKIPVMSRLRAKLALKGLFLASLDGSGTRSADLCASLLIIDDEGPAKTIENIEELLGKFEAAFPDKVSVENRENGETIYCFKLRGKDDLNSALIEAATDISSEIVPTILRRLTAEKFSDLSSDGADAFPADCAVVWRGSMRRGRLNWDASGNNEPGSPVATTGDWAVTVNFAGRPLTNKANDISNIEWCLADLSADEIDTLKRFHVLQTNNEIREKFGEYLPAAVQSYSIAIEKIWKRSLFIDGFLMINGHKIGFDDGVTAVHTISQLFTIMLESAFDEAYPEHPFFARVLTNREAALLVSNFFGGARSNFADVQEMAGIFLLPLGLVIRKDDLYLPGAGDELRQLSFIRDAFAKVGMSADKTVPLDTINARMAAAPYGLSREARHLIVTALVAQREYDFVTTNGNRINSRSLDLQIIWDDIVGLALPRAEVYSTERLLKWGSVVTGSDAIRSLDKATDRSVIVKELTNWLEKWDQSDLLEKFEGLPDQRLTSHVWRKASNVKRSFGSVAEAVTALVQNQTPVDQCLNAIADAFSDSDDEYSERQIDLAMIDVLTRDSADRSKMIGYIAGSEFTGNEKVEQLRELLIELLADNHMSVSSSANAEIANLFDEYKRLYSDIYLTSHDAIMNSTETKERFAELMATTEWFEFENLSSVRLFETVFADRARSIIAEADRMVCRSATLELLKKQPRCNCAFTFTRGRGWKVLPGLLAQVIRTGIEYYRKTMDTDSEIFVKELTKFSVENTSRELAPAITKLLSRLKNNGGSGDLSPAELYILRLTKGGHPLPRMNKFNKVSHDDLTEWEDEFDEQLTEIGS